MDPQKVFFTWKKGQFPPLEQPTDAHDRVHGHIHGHQQTCPRTFTVKMTIMWKTLADDKRPIGGALVKFYIGHHKALMRARSEGSWPQLRLGLQHGHVRVDLSVGAHGSQH